MDVTDKRFRHSKAHFVDRPTMRRFADLTLFSFRIFFVVVGWARAFSVCRVRRAEMPNFLHSSIINQIKIHTQHTHTEIHLHAQLTSEHRETLMGFSSGFWYRCRCRCRRRCASTAKAKPIECAHSVANERIFRYFISGENNNYARILLLLSPFPFLLTFSRSY